MRYTLRQIEVFLATARYANISRAAESLAMSQSAASGALNELESRYDAPLFDRVGKRLQLNALGEALRPQAEALMAQAAELDAFLQQDSVIGKLRLGATLTIGNYLAVSMLAEFMQRYQG
ncbi:LysR family transcriptional regulator, partial [bacterium]|nr:LysR family transcriptional regulator [bacterium]